eukprot:3091213-Prymnesium_polylepis.1
MRPQASPKRSDEIDSTALRGSSEAHTSTVVRAPPMRASLRRSVSFESAKGTCTALPSAFILSRWIRHSMQRCSA